MKTHAKALSAVAAAVVALSTALPAQAMLVLQGPEDFEGTGLGSVNTILTLVGSATDVISGDAMTGASQTQTRSIEELGITSASDIRVVFNALEPGNGANSVSLEDLVLTIFSPTGTALFSTGAFTPIDFADTFTGAGNSGFVFALDAAQAAAAQAAAFVGDFGANLFGISASVSDAQTYALMLAGLGAVGFMAFRRRRSEN